MGSPCWVLGRGVGVARQTREINGRVVRLVASVVEDGGEVLKEGARQGPSIQPSEPLPGTSSHGNTSDLANCWPHCHLACGRIQSTNIEWPNYQTN